MAGQQPSKEERDFTDVANGPLSEADRQCRDVLCCLLFLVNIVAMAYCAIQGFANGNLTKIWRATDQNGVVCGQPGGVAENFPYSYFYDPLNSMNSRYCVTQCPSYTSGTINVVTCYDATSSGICPSTTAGYFVVSEDGTSVSGSSGPYLYGSYTFFSRICIPNANIFSGAFNGISSTFYGVTTSGTFSNFVQDLQNNWQWILLAFSFCVILAFVWMYALKCVAGCIVWVSIFGIIFFFVAMGVIFLYNAGQLGTLTAYASTMGIPDLQANSNYDVYGYICFGIAGLLFLVLLCCCSRLRLAVAVCKAAGQFVSTVCLIVLVPIWQTLFVGILWLVAIIAIVYLASAAQFTYNSGDVFTSIKSYSDEKLIYLYYFIFGTLWSNALIQAMGIFVIASSCAMWYYSHGPGQQLDSPILRGYKMAFRYHFGSLAFGSLILAIVQFMQLIVQAFKKQAQSSGADQNPCFEYVINCLRCCLACVQRIVQFINKTAYIQIAIRGKNFCMAAYDGFDLVWSNAMRYAIVSGVGEIIMFIGKILIAACTAFAFYCLISFVASIAEGVMEPILLVVIVFIIGYAVSTLFMAVYSIAMDTLLACFIIDENNQKAKGGKAPLYAPQELAELIDRD